MPNASRKPQPSSRPSSSAPNLALIVSPQVKPRLSNPYRPALLVINVILPLVFSALVVLQFATGFEFSDHFFRSSRFIASVLGMNVLHNYLSILIVLALPEGRTWARRGARDQGLFWRSALVFFGTFVSLMVLEKVFPTSDFTLSMIFLIFNFLTIHHAVAQNLGLGLVSLTDTQAELSTEELQRKNRLAAIEKKLRLPIFGGSFLRALSQVDGFWTLNPALEPWKNLVKETSFFMVMISIAVILIFTRRLPGNIWRNKFLINAKLIVFAAPINFTALMGSNFVHGWEYVMVFDRMVSGSRAKSKKNLLLVILPITLLLGFLITFFRHDDFFVRTALGIDKHAGYSIPLKLLACLSFSISILHFYLDAQIFRMSDPSSRKLIGALFYARSPSKKS